MGRSLLILCITAAFFACVSCKVLNVVGTLTFDGQDGELVNPEPFILAGSTDNRGSVKIDQRWDLPNHKHTQRVSFNMTSYGSGVWGATFWRVSFIATDINLNPAYGQFGAYIYFDLKGGTSSAQITFSQNQLTCIKSDGSILSGTVNVSCKGNITIGNYPIVATYDAAYSFH